MKIITGKIITGKTGTPHITSQQDRDINCAVFGSDSYVMPVGERLKAEQQTSNTIRIRDGLLVMQGCAASIDSGAFDDVQIENGSQGVNRIDLIVARYTQETETGYESVKIQVIKGTPANSPKPPAVQTGEIRKGVKTVDFVLYEVQLEAITIESVKIQVIKGTPANSPKPPAVQTGEIRKGVKTVDFVLYEVQLEAITIKTITAKFKTVDRSLYDLAKNQKVLWSNNYGFYMASNQTITLAEPVSAQPHGIVLLWCGASSDGQAKNQKVLWSNNYGFYMASNQTITLAEPVSAQPHGIVLLWCGASSDGQSKDAEFLCQFIPKKAVSMFNNKGFSFFFPGYSFENISAKYVYVSENSIRGNDLNMEKATKNGITYDNRNCKLRAVIGV